MLARIAHQLSSRGRRGAVLLLVAFADTASAQPIEIRADQFEMLLDERVTTYTGNVFATQGSRAIRGQELVVHFNDDNEITTMRASGTPATLADGAQDSPITVAGETLDYDFDASVVRADGNGVLSRGGDTISAATIVYDLDTERARAIGDDSRRVTVRLAPDKDSTRPD